ncbi:MAG: hypothetical protein EPN25_10195 [Nitrospirae bacterium]|nr:MAG: hypothetical protein EPN25_10195 [Nitrospirota bacterium]
MLVGYNTNVPFKGTLYHVQTEDSGLKNPVITTLLYDKGTILSSKKVSYAHIANSPDYKEKVRELMKEQHKSMMKELISGKHTGGAAEKPLEEPPAEQKAETKKEKPAPEAAPETTPQPPKSLDDILLDFIISKGE